MSTCPCCWLLGPHIPAVYSLLLAVHLLELSSLETLCPNSSALVFGAFLRQSLSRVHLWIFVLAVGCWDRIIRSFQFSSIFAINPCGRCHHCPILLPSPLPVQNYLCCPDRTSPPDNFALHPPLGYHALAAAAFRTVATARRCSHLVLAAPLLLGARACPSD